jgi:hypothetical protein
MPRSEKTLPPRKRRLSSQPRKALRLLASYPDGAEELFMIAHAFKRELLDGLVVAKLVTV